MGAFDDFYSGVQGRIKGKKAVSDFDRSMGKGVDEAWGKKKRKRKAKKGKRGR